MASCRGPTRGAPLSLFRGVAERSLFGCRRHRSRCFPESLISSRVMTSSCLFRRDLRAHYGCVNAIEFSAGEGRMIASGSCLEYGKRPRLSRRSARNCAIEQLLVVVGLGLGLG